MWAIIKAILVYILCRVVFGFLTFGFIAVTADHWSFWVSLAIAVYVLIKSW